MLQRMGKTWSSLLLPRRGGTLRQGNPSWGDKVGGNPWVARVGEKTCQGRAEIMLVGRGRETKTRKQAISSGSDSWWGKENSKKGCRMSTDVLSSSVLTELGTWGFLVCSAAGLDSALSYRCVYITVDYALDSTANILCSFLSGENSMQLLFAFSVRRIILFQLFNW